MDAEGRSISCKIDEILGDPYAPEVTHYGWQAAEYRLEDPPTRIQVRADANPSDPKQALMFLSMCFSHGLDAAIKQGHGRVVALRITEHPGRS